MYLHRHSARSGKPVVAGTKFREQTIPTSLIIQTCDQMMDDLHNSKAAQAWKSITATFLHAHFFLHSPTLSSTWYKTVARKCIHSKMDMANVNQLLG